MGKLELNFKQIGLIIVLTLGALMLLLPDSDANQYSFKPETIAELIDSGADQISPEELSRWIIKGKNHYQLIDIRSEDEYGVATIKGAVNIPLERLLKKDTIQNELSDSQMVVIFSNGNSHAHQAWLVLSAAGKNVYVLEGGFNAWAQKVLAPKISKDPSDDEIMSYLTLKAVSQFLGGGGSGDVGDLKPGQKKKRPMKGRKKRKLKGCA